MEWERMKLLCSQKFSSCLFTLFYPCTLQRSTQLISRQNSSTELNQKNKHLQKDGRVTYSLRPNAGTMSKIDDFTPWESSTTSAVSSFMPSVLSGNQDNIDNTTNILRSLGAANMDRGYSTWMKDYLKPEGGYSDAFFSRRFGLPNKGPDLQNCNGTFRFMPERWWTLRNASGCLGILGDVKSMGSLRVFTKYHSYDSVDNGARMDEETVRRYFQIFLRDIRNKYGHVCLKGRPTVDEMDDIDMKYQDAGISGCTGALNCCHLKW